MELCLNQRQLSMLIKSSVNQRLKIYEQDATSAPVAGTDPEAAKPSAGTGDTGAKTGYPEVTKWESGVERGADNQIAVTKWSDIVGSKITRGKSNPLTEQDGSEGAFTDLWNKQGSNPMGITQGKDYSIKNISSGIAQELLNDTSNGLLKLREFWFSDWGFFTQIAVSIVGDSFGLPADKAVLMIDAAIAANDVILFSNSWYRGSFKWGGWDNMGEMLKNKEFFNICQDLLFVAGYGLIRGAGKMISTLQKLSRIEMGATQRIGGELQKIKDPIQVFGDLFSKYVLNPIKSFLKFLPKSISNFISKNLPQLQKIDSDIRANRLLSKNIVKRTTFKLSVGLVKSGLVFYVGMLGVNIASKLLGMATNLIMNPDQQTLDAIVKNGNKDLEEYAKNPNVNEEDFMYEQYVVTNFPNVKRNQFQKTQEIYKNSYVFIINGVKYYNDVINGQLKFIKR